MKQITFLVEGHEVCQWSEVKEAALKYVSPFKEDSIAKPLIHIILSLIEFIILSKATKEAK